MTLAVGRTSDICGEPGSRGWRIDVGLPTDDPKADGLSGGAEAQLPATGNARGIALLALEAADALITLVTRLPPGFCDVELFVFTKRLLPGVVSDAACALLIGRVTLTTDDDDGIIGKLELGPAKESDRVPLASSGLTLTRSMFNLESMSPLVEDKEPWGPV